MAITESTSRPLKPSLNGLELGNGGNHQLISKDDNVYALRGSARYDLVLHRSGEFGIPGLKLLKAFDGHFESVDKPHCDGFENGWHRSTEIIGYLTKSRRQKVQLTKHSNVKKRVEVSRRDC